VNIAQGEKRFRGKSLLDEKRISRINVMNEMGYATRMRDGVAWRVEEYIVIIAFWSEEVNGGGGPRERGKRRGEVFI
jgi:hypothetical protein